MPTRSSPAMGPRATAGGVAGRGLGAGRAAGRFLGAARRTAGLPAAALFLSGLDFLRVAGFLAGVFLRLTLAFGLFFAAIMAPPWGCRDSGNPSRPDATYQSRQRGPEAGRAPGPAAETGLS